MAPNENAEAFKPPIDNPTLEIVKMARGVGIENLPQQTQRRVRSILLDTIGCAVAGSTTEVGRIVADYCAGEHGPLEATMLGHKPVSLLSAVFANTIFGNALDYDAFGPEGHMAVVVVPAALAVAEAIDSSSDDLITAIALGMEMGGRLGAALRRPTKSKAPLTGHTFATIGAMVAAGRLLNLSENEFLNAFGIAAYSAQIPTLRRFFSKSQDAMTKYDHIGLAARNGVEAALLARRGFTGDQSVLEGDYPFWRLSGAEGCDWDHLLTGLGEVWKLDTVEFKPYPVGTGSVPIIELLLGLISNNDLTIGDLDHVEVLTRTHYLHHEKDVSTPIEAWTDLRYGLALAILRVRPYRDWYEAENISNPVVQSMMKRISILPLNTGLGRWSTEITLQTQDGRSFTGSQHGASPVTRAQIVEKFRDNLDGFGFDTAKAVRFCQDADRFSVRSLASLFSVV
ncbi:2-methylcitrate dehydratase PrpD [Paraburkholderia sp. RAU6.4a]|uniref:MmgE/PrpD family protein n=1 Tax=Paraburkholderia sp. RAU6.4a TaxID=2991067 RepID=UPI003D21C694